MYNNDLARESISSVTCYDRTNPYTDKKYTSINEFYEDLYQSLVRSPDFYAVIKDKESLGIVAEFARKRNWLYPKVKSSVEFTVLENSNGDYQIEGICNYSTKQFGVKWFADNHTVTPARYWMGVDVGGALQKALRYC